MMRRGEIDVIAAVHGGDDIAPEPVEEEELVAIEQREHAEVIQRLPTRLRLPAVTCFITAPPFAFFGQLALTVSGAEARSLDILHDRRPRVSAYPRCRLTMAS